MTRAVFSTEMSVPDGPSPCTDDGSHPGVFVGNVNILSTDDSGCFLHSTLTVYFIQCWSSTSPKQHIGEETGAQGGCEHCRDVVIEVLKLSIFRIVGLSVCLHKVLECVKHIVNSEAVTQAEREDEDSCSNQHPHLVGA